MEHFFSHLASTHALIVAFAFVGAVMWISNLVSKVTTRGRVHGSAIAILIGLVLAYLAGVDTGGQKGVVDWPWLGGIGLMGGAMLRDFAIVATAFEVDVVEAKKAGLLGVIALAIGTVVPFIIGALVALAYGYDDAISMATIGAVSNPDQQNVKLGKAGRSRWLGVRPSVRGVATNPIDHPHGGGEGKTSGGRHPVSPWGKPEGRTRKRKASDQMIVRRRKSGKR